MLTNYLKIILRNIRKNRIYSVINISSLAIGLATGMLVLMFVEQQLDFDIFHKKSNRIFRVINDRKLNDHEGSFSDISPLWGPILQEEFPEVVEMTRIMHPAATGGGEFIIEHENKYYREQNPLFADENIFNVFDIKLNTGNPNIALKEPRSIVLSEKLAKKYFPNEEPVGKTIFINMWINYISDNPDGFESSGDYLITGVACNMPPNSHFQFDLLISFSSIKFWEMYNIDIHTITGINTYLVLPEGYTSEELEAKMPVMVKKHQSAAIEKTSGVSYDEFLNSGKYFQYRLQKLTDIHLGSDNLRSNKKLSSGGDVKDVYFFILIALAVILISAINFINIITAQLGNRAHEVGLRKVLGSRRSQLICQFLLETIIISFCAVLLATLIAVLALKLFNRFIQVDLTIYNFITGWVISGIFGITLIVGFLAGIYPAILFSKLKPITILKNSIQTSTGSGGILFRNGLVIFQFCISVIFIVSSLVVFNQLSFITNKPLGFNKEHVVTVYNAEKLRTGGLINGINRVELFKQELSRNSNIINVAGTTGGFGFLASNPSIQYFIPEGKSEEEKVWLGCQLVDRNVFETFGLDVVTLREDLANSSSESIESVVLNEAAVKFLNLTDPVGKTLTRYNFNRTCRIVGVVKDFHFQSLHETIAPLVLILVNHWNPLTSIKSIYIRINPVGVPETIADIKRVSEQLMPGQPFEYSFLDEDIDRYYRSEKQLGELFGFLSGITIFLSYLGIFGLTSYMIYKRTKEIAIRKILGATIKNIVHLLSRKFFKLALIAFVLSIPISYFLMDNWLQEFAYRIEIRISTFVYACSLIIFIMVISVSMQAFRSAISNPVDSLKYE